MNFVPMKMEQ